MRLISSVIHKNLTPIFTSFVTSLPHNLPYYYLIFGHFIFSLTKQKLNISSVLFIILLVPRNLIYVVHVFILGQQRNVKTRSNRNILSRQDGIPPPLRVSNFQIVRTKQKILRVIEQLNELQKNDENTRQKINGSINLPPIILILISIGKKRRPSLIYPLLSDTRLVMVVVSSFSGAESPVRRTNIIRSRQRIRVSSFGCTTSRPPRGRPYASFDFKLKHGYRHTNRSISFILESIRFQFPFFFISSTPATISKSVIEPCHILPKKKKISLNLVNE